MKTNGLIEMFLSILLTITFLTGCSDEYDDSLLTDRVDNLENRVNKLEELCSQMNTNISSLQTLINALQERDYITNVTSITKEDKIIGYTITFAKNNPITIYHGEDGENGKDGSSPMIGVKKHTDNIYYWTVNGEWLFDDAGNKIKAEGTDGTNGSNGTNGANGNDGITPKLKIENDYWFVSYDNGSTWTELGKATGENDKDGSNLMIGVKKHTDNIYYWTVNGEWLFDDAGNKIKAEGTDGTNGSNGTNGANGNDGITPKLKIENGYWFVSYDNGSTWTELGKATGENGTNSDSMFSDITYDDDYVYITLTNGTTLVIPRSNPNSNIIKYTATSKVVLANDKSIFGANIISNEWDIETGNGLITFDKTVTSIGDYAFDFCKNLISITIPNSVTKIGYAFRGCKSLIEISIPNSVNEIHDGAFESCISLKKFEGKFSSEDGKCLIINGRLLRFALGCELTEYTLPNTVTTILAGAFGECTFTSITIPESVTLIGHQAFNYTYNLTNVYCKSSTPPQGTPYMFDGDIYNHETSAKIYVPIGSGEAYKTADYWKDYAEIIE